MAYRLGIDIGTTNTVATVAVDGRAVEMVGLGVNTPAMRSVLFIGDDGRLLVGDSAVARGSADAARMILDPRRRLGTDLPVEIDGAELTPEQATAAVLGFVRDRATAQQGGAPVETVVTYPAHWNEYQLDCLDRAIDLAELGHVRRCSEAEAAAATYAAGHPLPVGANWSRTTWAAVRSRSPCWRRHRPGYAHSAVMRARIIRPAPTSTRPSSGWPSAAWATAAAISNPTIRTPAPISPSCAVRAPRRRRICPAIPRRRCTCRCPATRRRCASAARSSNR